LDEAAAAATQAQNDLDKANAALQSAAQSFLNQIKKAVQDQDKDADLIYSLTAPPKSDESKWFAVQFDGGVKIWVSFPKATADDVATFRSKLGEFIRGVASNQKGKFNALAAAVNAAQAKYNQAQIALASAQAAYDDCVQENNRPCAEAELLQHEYDECLKQAAAQAEAERKAQEKDEADRKAAEETERQNKATAAQAEAEAKRKADADRRAADEALKVAKERAHQRQLCTDCLKFLLAQQAGNSGVSDQNTQALQQLSDALDKVNDALDKADAASDILPASFQEQLENLADALGKIAELRDLANNINGILAKIKQLATGGNDPAQFATVLQLLSDALGMVAQRVPLLGPLANYLKLLADAGDAIIHGLPNAIGAEAARKWGGMIDAWQCPSYAEFLHGYHGDLDAIYRRVFGAAERDIIARTPKAEEKLRAALLAKIQRCCIEMITKECAKTK
jgi:hypothetical protein